MQQEGDVIISQASDCVELQGSWIWEKRDAAWEQGVTCFFRRKFRRNDVGDRPVLRISADSRYRAWLNGKLVSRGPCRGTVEHYHYETVDLSQNLVEGENVLAVEVRWYGRRFEPRAEAHLYPALWAMIGDDEKPNAIVTDSAWRVFRSPGHHLQAIPTNHPVSGWYCVVDPQEVVDLSQVPTGWREIDFDDSAWTGTVELTPALRRYQARSWWFCAHELEAREIPPMEEMPILPAAIEQIGTITVDDPLQIAKGIEGTLVSEERRTSTFWGDNPTPLTLEGQGTHYVILHMGRLVTGYPRLTVTAPKGTGVEFRYAEALSQNYKKSVRDDPTGTVEGYYDLFFTPEGEVVIEPFIWRTFRFVRLAVHHPDGPVTIQRLDTTLTAYPFIEKATFESSDPLHKKIWDVSWWTLRMCAHEHFEDCPYYEQMQYIYDTRLESRVSYLVAGDFRLARQALRQIAQSRRSDGITMSRAPSVGWEPSIIPPLSLQWIEFLEDFYMYSGDLEIVRELWDCVESILKWFDSFDSDGLLKNVPYWKFTDWTLPITEKSIAESSADLNMRRIGALQAAGRLAKALGNPSRSDDFQRKSVKAIDAVKRHFWDESIGLFRDELDGTLAAEHASIHAVLYEVVDKTRANKILDRLAERTDLGRTSLAYCYDTFRAYEKIGRYEEVYRSRLYNWTDQLKLHATTWFETKEPSRSDCHGWGSWIMGDLLTSVLGITPAEPGFKRVRITPHLMDLAWARGMMPTVRGIISVQLKSEKNNIRYQIDLPKDVTGCLVTSRGEERPLKPGRNEGNL
jgi:hypothetical protein